MNTPPTDNSNFISTDELAHKIDAGSKTLRIVDASWYLPSMQRDGREEFQAKRIPGAVFFDIDEIADTGSNLPHMLPAPDLFAKAVGNLGLSNTDEITVYDGSGLFSAARVWWSLRVMGASDVKILSGGFPQWIRKGLPVETGVPKRPPPAIFKPAFHPDKVRDKAYMLANINRGETLVLDARPYERFCGTVAEPRPGLRAGHIPGSRSLPVSQLVENGALLERSALQQKMSEFPLESANHVTTSCGSGVTAAIISLALDELGITDHSLYDGSWADWGGDESLPLATWEE